MKKIILLLFCISINSYAGFNGFTVHSRGNCVGFNESISWDWYHEWLLITTSEHVYKGRSEHTLRDEPRWTRRSAAFHALESYDIITRPWKINGIHWRHYTDGNFHLEGWETANDCSGYDGWWDV